MTTKFDELWINSRVRDDLKAKLFQVNEKGSSLLIPNKKKIEKGFGRAFLRNDPSVEDYVYFKMIKGDDNDVLTQNWVNLLNEIFCLTSPIYNDYLMNIQNDLSGYEYTPDLLIEHVSEKSVLKKMDIVEFKVRQISTSVDLIEEIIKKTENKYDTMTKEFNSELVIFVINYDGVMNRLNQEHDLDLLLELQYIYKMWSKRGLTYKQQRKLKSNMDNVFNECKRLGCYEEGYKIYNRIKTFIKKDEEVLGYKLNEEWMKRNKEEFKEKRSNEILRNTIKADRIIENMFFKNIY